MLYLKMKKEFLLLPLILVSCNSIKKDYIITSISYSPTPKWVKKEYQKPDKDYKYFVSKAENTNQRLCEKTASARANLVVASEISTMINNTYKSVVESKNEETKELSNEVLEQSVQVYLAGVEQAENYWEKRKYTKELGAEKDIVKYQCYSLIKMNKKNYERAVNASVDKMMRLLQEDNKELKQEIKDKVLE